MTLSKSSDFITRWIDHKSPKIITVAIDFRHSVVLFGMVSDHGKPDCCVCVVDAEALHKFAACSCGISLSHADCVRSNVIFLRFGNFKIHQIDEIIVIYLFESYAFVFSVHIGLSICTSSNPVLLILAALL